MKPNTHEGPEYLHTRASRMGNNIRCHLSNNKATERVGSGKRNLAEAIKDLAFGWVTLKYLKHMLSIFHLGISPHTFTHNASWYPKS